MSYLDKIIDTDGWGDKKNSKIFELMKHNQEKFGYRNVPVVAAAPAVVEGSVDSAPMASSPEVKPAPVLKPYRPFEAKHNKFAAATKAAQTAAKAKTKETGSLYPDFGQEKMTGIEKKALNKDFQKDIPLALQDLHTHH